MDSWYAKPNFIKEAKEEGVDVVARIANNNKIWNFKGKYKTLNGMYNALSKIKHEKFDNYGKIHYHYFDTIVSIFFCFNKSFTRVKDIKNEIALNSTSIQKRLLLADDCYSSI